MSEEIFIQQLKQEYNQSSQKVPQPQTYPAESVFLPSKGFFYPEKSPLSKGTIDVKMMTAKEEDILTNENFIKSGTVLDRLLESLIVTPNVKVSDLLMVDKNALFIAARRLAYGDSYGPLKINCRKCGEENNTVVNLGEMNEKPVDFGNFEKGLNEFEFTFPYSKRKIIFKLLSSGDEDAIDKDSKALSKIKKNASAEVTTRLKRLIVELDGKRDQVLINNFVENELLSKDSMALRAYIRTISPEIDMGFNFTCEHCSNSERMDVPMTVQFFWPES